MLNRFLRPSVTVTALCAQPFSQTCRQSPDIHASLLLCGVHTRNCFAESTVIMLTILTIRYSFCSTNSGSLKMDDKAEFNLTEIVVIGLDGYKTEN
jgi:hypothetical protein